MPRYDFISQRLFVDQQLTTGTHVELERNQSNYLINVLRLKSGAPVLVFNGKDGEWQAELVDGSSQELAAGDWATVVDVQGIRLIVEVAA